MNKIVMMAMFSVILNLVGGLITTVIVDIDGNQLFTSNDENEEILKGEGYSDDLVSGMEDSIKPSGSIDDKGDQIYRVLDTIKLGFVYKFVETINDYMFGFVDIIDSILGDYLLPEVRGFLFGDSNDDNLIPNKTGAVKVAISILYIFASIKLFTGKDLVEN